MSGGSPSNYVTATTIKQVGGKQYQAQVANMWLGKVRTTDDDDAVFVALEIKPAWGSVAQIRFSLDELRDLEALILDRLGITENLDNPSVQVSVPEGTAVEIVYT